jgi:predicted XRE-type DNA-binding protein
MKGPRDSMVTEGTTNVFADLGLAHSDELLAKARLASMISDLVEDRGLTQAEAAKLLGTTQPKVSNLVNGRLEGFSLERLARFLNMLDRDVEIVVTPRSRSRQAARIFVRTG